jgi:uncharacterized protein (TIGR02231 family)
VIRTSGAQAIEGEAVRERLALALQPVERQEAAERAGLANELRKKAMTAQVPRARRVYAPAPSAPSGAPSAAPAAAPMMEPMEADADYEESAVAMAPPPPSIRMHKSVPGSSMSLALLDTASARPAPTFGDPLLPAVTAGGLSYVYQAPTATPIPSTGRQIRVPLASQTFAAAAFHEATPALAPTAFLRARVRNDGKRPLLRGPATIFSDGELVGVGEVQTTGPGGDIEFPLGADEDVRLVRQVVPSTKTTGLIMKTDETIYDVQIQVGNYKKKKVAIELRDQVPRSTNAKVEVKLLATDPAPVAAPDGDGVVRWRLELAPGATRTVHLRYQISRPKGWQLYQR